MAMLPLNYNLRSLFVRKSITLLTILSTGATVAVLAGVLSLQQGFATMFTADGRDDLAIIMRPGAGSEGESMIERSRAEILMKGTPVWLVDRFLDDALKQTLIWFELRRSD